MSDVDPQDDSLLRYVVQHYRYDPERHERRHVVVAAFDNEREFHAYMDVLAAQLRHRQEMGESLDRNEHVSGAVLAPNYRRLQQNGRLLRRAIEHGVLPRGWEQLELPPNVAILTAGDTWSG